MKTLNVIVLLIFLSAAAGLPAAAASDSLIYLIVRGDDIGSSHAANLGCIASYKEGIQKTVEIMVPCPWFLEAVEMLKTCPGLDVGVHLTLTSEWEHYKWGPLTCAPSLVDSNGYFYPRQKNWSDQDATDAFWNAGPDMTQVEQELRAQIVTAMRHIPQVSHVTGHMGIASPGVSQKMSDLVERLAREYGLYIDLEAHHVKRTGPYFPDEQTAGFASMSAEQRFIQMLRQLKSGAYLYVEHPGMDVPEMQAIGHTGNDEVAKKRAEVTRVFTSDRVNAVIQELGIQLISYADLVSGKEN
ncbi:MAG: polysaccharide deacetylase family protein [candidate division KSB1 bacterium]|nr:polysaccharide deacetylase family protein [candidate division KSB1 bacterium]